MKDNLLSLYENLKERLKTLIAEQQETELYIRLKEKYESFPYNIQKLIKYTSAVLAVLLVMWWPMSIFFDSSDFNTQFDERRQALKDILRLQRDFATVPAPPLAPPPMSMKAALDQKAISHGVPIEQIKETIELNGNGPANVEQKGVQYTLNHVTIRQAIDIAYDFEQTDKSFRLSDFEVLAEQQDPHFYNMKLKIINFSPKAQVVAAAEKDGKKVK
jgi:hypothetical protein